LCIHNTDIDTRKILRSEFRRTDRSTGFARWRNNNDALTSFPRFLEDGEIQGRLRSRRFRQCRGCFELAQEYGDIQILIIVIGLVSKGDNLWDQGDTTFCKQFAGQPAGGIRLR